MATKEKLDLEFLREPSTVGELISLTDRPIRRQSVVQARRGSLPTSRSEGTRSRSRGRQRTNGAKSVSPVIASPKRKGSISTSRKNSILNSSRRESAELSGRNSGVPTPDDRESPSKGNRTRRQSMLNVLRGELEKLPCILAVHKRRQSPDKDVDNVFTDTETGNETEAESVPSSRHTLSKKNSFKTRRTSSVTPIDPILTDAEIRKLQMIQTLAQMGGPQRRLSRKDSMNSESGEAAIMEATYGMRKRGSIATRVMLVAAKRKSNMSLISSDSHASESKQKLAPLPINTSKETPAVTSDSEDFSDDQKQKASKVMDLFKRPGNMKPLPGIGLGKVKSSEDTAVESMNVFRRKLRRRKLRRRNRFKKIAKFLILLLRAWRIHSVAINDVLVDNNTSLDMITSATDPADLLFDVTQFKAVKEAKVSQEAIRILKKRPKERTEEEQYYIQIALRNYKSIAEYPVNMQKLIAQRSWYESYDPKRVIVREGHVPMCFYFILSGSGVVSTSEGGSQKTVMFLNRGDSFGDVAILNNSRRETTVISREKLELLVMGDTDFTDIFMAGGINNPNDPFLKSINFLDGWPVEKLIENPKKCIFSFFKRGTVLVEDSTTSEWIFIIRSGSASILKKLQSVKALTMPKVERKPEFRDEIMNMMKNETYLSHEEQLKFLHEEQKREVDDQNLLVRYYALPEINVATNDSYNELKQMREEYMNENTLNRAMVEVADTLPPDKDEARSEAGNSSATGVTAQSKRRRMSLQNINLSKMVERGPFMLKSRGGPRNRGDSASTHGRSTSRRSSVMSIRDDSHVDVNDETAQKIDDWQQMSLPTIDEPDMVDLREKIRENKSVFVEVKNLTKGQTFGLAEMLFEGQPNFSLVSNGAECVMIEKKFFMEHATYKHIVKLREATYPYPSNEALQENLASQMRWDHHKKKCLHKMLRDVRIKKADRNDARALLQIPQTLKV